MADDDFFSQFGGSVDAPSSTAVANPSSSGDDFFSQFNGQQTTSPEDAGRQTVAALNTPDAVLPASPQDLVKAAPGYYGTSALGRLVDAGVDAVTGTPTGGQDQGGFLNAVTNAKNSVVNLAGGIGSGIGNMRAQTMADYAKNGPFLVGLHQLEAIGAGLPGAAYNVVSPVANAVEKGVGAFESDGLRTLGYNDAAANLDAQRDLDRIDYEKSYEQPAQQALLASSPLPAVTTATQNVAPLLAPVGAGLETGELAANAGNAIRGAASSLADGAVGSATTDAASRTLGHMITPGFGGYVTGKLIKPAIHGAIDNAGNLAGIVTQNGINAAVPIATGFTQGLLSADPGEEAEGARAGAAQGALAAPLSMYGGRLTRQSLDLNAENDRLTGRGMQSYGVDPTLDAQHSAGMAALTPDQQNLINANRGFLRSINTPDGDPLQVYVQTPQDFANGAVAANGGQVDDAANARGYYNDGTGKIFLNAGQADTTGALAGALGHEAAHGILQDGLPGVNPKVAARLTDSIRSSSLGPTGQPTSAFQTFINDYNGGTPVDWNSLPDDGPGASKLYYLKEAGAETANALNFAQNPAAFSIKPSAETLIGNAMSDFGRRIGLPSPDLTATLGTNSGASVDPSLLRATRNSLYAAGDAVRADADSPVRYAQPAKSTSTPTSPAGQSTPEASGAANQTSVQPDTSFRQTPAYDVAFKALTNGSVGKKMDPALATAMLDTAAQRADVPNTTEDYLRYAQTGQPPRAPTVAPQGQPIIAPQQPAAPNPGEPVLAPVARALAPDPAAPALTASAPVVPVESDAPILAPMTGKAGLPPAGPDEPNLAPPADQPVNRFTDLRPDPETDPRDKAEVSNPAPDSPPQPSPQNSGDLSSESGASAVPTPGAERIPPHPDQPQSQGLARENPSPAPTAIAEQNPAPLSKDDMARIEAETEANFKPAPYNPRGTPEEKAAKIAARNASDLEDAKDRAVSDAHAAALPEGDTRVQMRVNPDTGRRTLSGTHFVDNDPFHQRLIGGDTEAKTRANLPAIQDAIRNGDLLNFDYDSAAETRTQQSAQQRRESQEASPAADRAGGIGDVEVQNKSLRPLSVSPNADGSVGVNGFSPEKMLGNAEVVMDAMRSHGLSDRLPYQDTNDPSFIQDVRDYIENHANGYKGDGSARLTSVDGVSVPDAAPGYQPHELPPTRANLMNIIMGQDQTLGRPALKDGTETGSGKLRRFAAANDNAPSESGEVNPLRDELNRKGLLKAGPDQGSRNLLHSVFETNRADLMSNFRDPTLPVDFTAQRGASYRGDRTQLAPGGKTPNSAFSGSGFLPSIVRAGEQIPGTTGRAAEDLPVQRFGNATVTGAGTQFLPAYHGTPHEVDKFDSSKIGTGEGAQVYGRGLYFADQRAVAAEYQKELSAPEFTSKETGETINAGHPEYPALLNRYQRMNSNGYGGDFAQGHDVRHGNLYTVDLDVHPERLLNWDAPLKNQSEAVQSALGPLIQKHIVNNEDFINAPLKKSASAGDIKASKLYQLLGGEISLANNSRVAPPQAASDALNQAGIHGIRYLDQGSRASGAGSNNYVMFDDSKIKITHRNDQPVRER